MTPQNVEAAIAIMKAHNIPEPQAMEILARGQSAIIDASATGPLDFPVVDFAVLKTVLQEKYNVDLKTLNISAAGTLYGLTKIKGKLLTMNHCKLEDDMQEEGQEFEVTEGSQIVSLDLTEVSQCVLPGNNRNEIEIQFPETDTMEAGTDQLGT